MPELPEVETVVLGLRQRLAGRRIRNIEITSRRIAPGDIARACGQKIKGVRRHGKFIVIDLEDGTLVAHLRMTGRFVFNEDPGPYTRAMITLDKGTVQFHDVRQFGTFEYCCDLPEHLTRLGPDALEITLPDFQQRLRAHNRQVKPLLLDQNFLRGMGNIYVDEALFRALIHPRTITAAIKPKRAAALHQAMLDVLTEALAQHGSSISSFKDPYGREGSFHNQHRVYGKAGELCSRCGKRKIVREVVAQRGTHFCPKCQPE